MRRTKVPPARTTHSSLEPRPWYQPSGQPWNGPMVWDGHEPRPRNTRGEVLSRYPRPRPADCQGPQGPQGGALTAQQACDTLTMRPAGPQREDTRMQTETKRVASNFTMAPALLAQLDTIGERLGYTRSGLIEALAMRLAENEAIVPPNPIRKAGRKAYRPMNCPPSAAKAAVAARRPRTTLGNFVSTAEATATMAAETGLDGLYFEIEADQNQNPAFAARVAELQARIGLGKEAQGV